MLDLFVAGFPAYPSGAGAGKNDPDTISFVPVGPRARRLLAVDIPAAASRYAKLLKLAVERLPVGADPGIADKLAERVSQPPMLRRSSLDSALEGDCVDALRGSRAFLASDLSCRLQVCVRPVCAANDRWP